MTQATRYARVLAKIGAERSTLLSESKLKTVSETKNLLEFTAQLRDSTYQDQITKIQLPFTSRKLERAFNENLIETSIKIIKNSPKRAANYLTLYLLRFEVENIKALIKAINANLDFEQKSAKIYFSAEEFLKNRSLLEDAAKTTTTKQMMNSFKNTIYSLALSMGQQSYDESGSTARLDILLDKVFYEQLSNAYDNLSKKEKLYSDYYASTENDSFTLLTLLRGKALGYDSNWLRLAVPRANFHLSPRKVETLVSSSDYDSALKVVSETSYSPFFVKAPSPEETISTAERAFKKAVIEHAKTTRVSNSFNIGATLSFMEQKRAEVHNLTAASSGIESGLNADFILSQLSL